MNHDDAASWHAEIAALRAEARHMRRAFSTLQERYFHCAAQLAELMPVSTGASVSHAVSTEPLPPLLEYYPDPMLVLNADRRVVIVNSRYLRLMNLPSEAIIGRSAAEVLGPEMYTAAVQACETRALGGELVEYEGWFDAPDGSHYMQCRYCPVEVDDGIAYLVITLRDFTDWKQADEEREYLLARNARHAAELDAVFTAMTDGVIVYNQAGEITLMNDAAERMLAYSPDIRALRVAERVEALRMITADGRPLPPAESPAARALRGEDVRECVLGLQYPDRALWLSAGAMPIRTADGDLHGAVVTLTDITMQHVREEEQRTFLHMVTHDLRVPITVIYGHREMLERAVADSGDAKARASLEAIGRAAQRMNVMIEDLVEAARLEGGQLQLAPQPVALAPYVAELLERAATLERARVTVEIPADLPPLHVDPDRLERILLNLLTNAQKYSAPGTPICLRAARAADGLMIAIADQGPGIAPQALPHLFERFYRVPDGRKADGIGLGLYITRRLVEAHGGCITVDSALGEGSVFTVTLPAAE